MPARTCSFHMRSINPVINLRVPLVSAFIHNKLCVKDAPSVVENLLIADIFCMPQQNRPDRRARWEASPTFRSDQFCLHWICQTFVRVTRVVLGITVRANEVPNDMVRQSLRKQRRKMGNQVDRAPVASTNNQVCARTETKLIF